MTLSAHQNSLPLGFQASHVCLLLLFSLEQFLSLLCFYIIPGWSSLPIVVEITPESTFPAENFSPTPGSKFNFCSSDAPVVSGILQTFFSDFQVLHAAALGILSDLDFWSQTDNGAQS